MAWAIRLTASAQRDLAKLDRATAGRVVRKLEASVKDPERAFERLKATDESKVRVGDWRVIAVLHPATKTVFAGRIVHRSVSYR